MRQPKKPPYGLICKTIASQRKRTTRAHKHARAIELLKRELAEGPKRSVEMLQIATDEGMHHETMRRAGWELGVLCSPEKGKPRGRWFWQLPELGPENGEEPSGQAR